MAAPEQVIQMASLGRPFRLGMVYDCRSDTLIPGITLWDPKELKKNIDVQPQPYFTSQIIASDSTSEKASLLNASASLKGSFLAGLIEVEGSAKFLQDTKKSARQARVTFSYAATTHFQQLTMSQVGKQHITYPEVFGQGLATHVVTGILYGAHAFFVFDQEASSSESLQNIEGNLQVLVKKIPKFSLEGKAEAQMSETEKAAIQKFSCTFYGDFKLKKNPTNYMEAVELYARLPELMGENGENAVPVKVWLYPLSYLDSAAAKLVREISSKLISDTENALEHLTEVDMRTNDLVRDPICTAFPEIKRKIHHFKGLCQQYRHEFQKDMGRLLPAIRGGGQEEEGALVNHLKKNEASLFNVSRLRAFLDLKRQEIRFVEFFLKLSKGEVSSYDEFMKKVLDPSVDCVFALVFSSLEAKEPYLEELDFGLQEAAGHAPKASPEKGNISTPWFQDKAVLERAQNAATIFADLSLRPQTKEKVQFVVTSSPDESNPGVSIVRYQRGSLEGTRFEILSKPLPPLVDEKTHCSVRLTFQPAKPERSRVSGYHVQYRVSGQENWVSVHVKEDIHPIRGLKAETSYEFRYAVETNSGCSVASNISQAMLNAFPSSSSSSSSLLSSTSSFWDICVESGGANTEERERRILLVGKPRGGKSSSGNTILGQRRFTSALSPKPVTLTCHKEERAEDWKGRKITIIDLPAIFDVNIPEAQKSQEIQKCRALSSPGPHALVFVTQVGRFTQEDIMALKKVEEVFGPEATKYMVVLFTRKEDLEGESLEDYVEGSGNRPLQDLVRRCQGRCCGFNNKLTGEESALQVEELLSLVEKVVQENHNRPCPMELPGQTKGKASHEASLEEHEMGGSASKRGKKDLLKPDKSREANQGIPIPLGGEPQPAVSQGSFRK